MCDIQVGVNLNDLKADITNALESMPAEVYEIAYQAAASNPDINHKAVIAAIAILHETLPEIVASAILKNNELLIRTIEKLINQLNKR